MRRTNSALATSKDRDAIKIAEDRYARFLATPPEEIE